MRTLVTLAALIVGLTVVFWAPIAKADCPHNGRTDHPHCDGGDPGGGAKVVFVSSDDTFTGDLGGVAGADATCNTLAADAGLSGDFKAWLGTWLPLGSNPLSHFTHASGPYVLTDGTQVARDFFQLISGTLENGIDLDENGDLVVHRDIPRDFVWSGVKHDGRVNSSNVTCSSWTSGSISETGRYGLSGEIPGPPGEWTDYGNDTCNQVNRIYCFEQ